MNRLINSITLILLVTILSIGVFESNVFQSSVEPVRLNAEEEMKDIESIVRNFDETEEQKSMWVSGDFHSHEGVVDEDWIEYQIHDSKFLQLFYYSLHNGENELFSALFHPSAISPYLASDPRFDKTEVIEELMEAISLGRSLQDISLIDNTPLTTSNNRMGVEPSNPDESWSVIFHYEGERDIPLTLELTRLSGHHYKEAAKNAHKLYYILTPITDIIDSIESNPL